MIELCNIYFVLIKKVFKMDYISETIHEIRNMKPRKVD